MNDPIQNSKPKPTPAAAPLPLSIKIIGWYHIALTLPIIVVSYVAGGLTEFLATSGKYEANYIVIILLIIGILFAAVPLLVGIGLFKKNKIAWYVAVIFNALGFLSLSINLWSVLWVIINALIVWKLAEYRRIF